MAMEKFCTKCGKKFVATGREVICPSCKESAKAEAKRAAVLRAKRASWSGESVPVRISGRSSTVIRAYGAEKSLPFAEALDKLLQASTFFGSMGMSWAEVEPYKSRRIKKSIEDVQDAPQDVQDAPQEIKTAQNKPVKAAKAGKAVKTANKK